MELIILDVTLFILPGRKHHRLRLEDYEYHVHKQEENRTRWRCAQERRHKCGAVLYTTGTFVEMRKGHTHAPAVCSDIGIIHNTRNVKLFHRNYNIFS